jgi:hypothetical protein
MTACRVCERAFQRLRPLQAVCSPTCAIRSVRRQKAEKTAETKRRREAVKSRSKWLSEAQQAFNAWIRARDAEDPCISCRRFHDGQWHAGHYLSTGSRPELRFDESNCHKQCQPCNTHLHGNLVMYRAELIRRIGLHEVERLEGPHPAKKYTIEDLREIRVEYRARLKTITENE